MTKSVYLMLVICAFSFSFAWIEEAKSDNTDTSTIICSARKYAKDGECKSCPSNALICHWDGSKVVIDECDSSNFYYYLKNNTCIQCSGNHMRACHWDGSKVVADSCYNLCGSECQDYYLKDGTCTACPAHTKCRLENGNLVVYGCQCKYTFVDGTCVKNEGNCIWDQYYKDGTCVSCPSGMSGCHWDGNKVAVDVCESKSYSSSVIINGKCEYCVGAPSCYIENGKAVARDCYQGYVLKNGVCQKCDGGAKCHLENNEIVADTCSSGYALINGKCQKCEGASDCYSDGTKAIATSCNSPAASCEWDGSKFVATSCQSGYILGGGQCYKCNSTAASCEWDGSKFVATSCQSGYILGGGQCYKCNSPAASCEWDGSKVVATSCQSGYIIENGGCGRCGDGAPIDSDGKTYYINDRGGTYNAYLPDSNGGCSKMTCRDAQMTDCTTEQFDNQGRPVAEYDADGAVAAYDYDDKGNLLTTYNDQCQVESCADGYRERDNSCVPECGEGYRDMGEWCNKIRWTPAEAAAVLTDDNNNSVTITFRK